jgi:cytochrome c553
MGPLPGGEQAAVLSDPSAAARLLDARKEALPKTVADDQIPEKVIIKGMAKDYQGVELPHRKIVHALMNDVAKSKLAKSFHDSATTLCQGCHHNSPAQPKPPACISCHGKSFTGNNPLRPGLMGAYHQQCMTCHEAMGIKKPASRDCTACHKKKAVS